MEVTSSLRHSLQSRSEWKGVGQSANHTCCKRHQNVELQFITVQAMQEDDDGNAFTTVKPDVAAVLRAKREIQPGEFIRYQYTDQSEHLKKIFECECCFHVGLCQQPHGKHNPALIHCHFAVFKLDCYQGAGDNLDVADPPLLGNTSGFNHHQSDLGRPCFRERLFRCMRTLVLCFYSDLVSLATWLSSAQQTHVKSGETSSIQR